METINKVGVYAVIGIFLVLFGWSMVNMTVWHYDVAQAIKTLQQIHIQEREAAK